MKRTIFKNVGDDLTEVQHIVDHIEKNMEFYNKVSDMLHENVLAENVNYGATYDGKRMVIKVNCCDNEIEMFMQIPVDVLYNMCFKDLMELIKRHFQREAMVAAMDSISKLL